MQPHTKNWQFPEELSKNKLPNFQHLAIYFKALLFITCKKLRIELPNQDKNMKALCTLYFVLFGIKCGLCSGPYESSTFMKYFFNTSTNSFVLCHLNGISDFMIDEFVTNAQNFGKWIQGWQCDIEDIPDAQNSLIILNDISEQQLSNVLTKENIQKSLRSNTWLIYTSDSKKDPRSYFSQNRLKIGINAQIFFVKHVNGFYSATQILGTATLDLKFKEMNYLNLLDIASIQESVKSKDNFEGAPFLANFVRNFPPYCYLDNVGDLVGMYPDALRIAANYLNLTLIYQQTKPENTDIWASRYERISISISLEYLVSLIFTD